MGGYDGRQSSGRDRAPVHGSGACCQDLSKYFLPSVAKSFRIRCIHPPVTSSLRTQVMYVVLWLPLCAKLRVKVVEIFILTWVAIGEDQHGVARRSYSMDTNESKVIAVTTDICVDMEEMCFCRCYEPSFNSMHYDITKIQAKKNIYTWFCLRCVLIGSGGSRGGRCLQLDDYLSPESTKSSFPISPWHLNHSINILETHRRVWECVEMTMYGLYGFLSVLVMLAFDMGAVRAALPPIM